MLQMSMVALECHYVISDMERKKPSGIPGTGALVAFESAGRLGSLSRAARELGTSQPAISIRVAKLEKHLSTRLFERSRTGVTLTDAGERFHEGVSTGLAVIRAAVAELAAWPRGEQVVIACSHEASHFLLMPRYQSLREALGEQVGIRILTYHYDRQNLPLAPVADVVMAWEANLGSEDCVVIHEEAVRPLCSPGYAAAHADVLSGPVSGWGGLTFLDLARPNEGWASWEDWFEAAGRPQHAPRYIGFDSYAYLLEAAVAGHGIALGWRHFIDRSLDKGTLVVLADRFIEFDNRYCGVLTKKGRGNPAAHKCLEFFERSAKFQSAEAIPASHV